MSSDKRIRRIVALVPLLVGLAGCGEDNEKNVKVEGTTTSPDAVTSTEEALKRGAEAKPSAKAAASAGYPGAGRRK